MKKQIQTAACVALTCVCLFGCGNQSPDRLAENFDTPKATASYGDGTAQASNPGAASGTQHVTQELCDNLYIDAEAVIPEGKEYSTYTIKMVDCDPDRLFNLFCPEGHGSYTMEDRGNCIVYDESSGKQLVIYEDSIDYRTYNFKMEERPMQDLESLMYYHTVEHPNAAPHDLSFMSVEEMEKIGGDLLTQLGIAWEPKLFRCVTLSGKEIMNFQQELFGDGGTYVQLGLPPISLAEADDACYLQFNFSWDGIPLIGFDEPTASSYENFGVSPDAKATIMITEDGIQTCTVSFPCTIEVASDPQQILNLEEAIALLKEKYDLQILDFPRKIVDIWMEYIPVKRDEEWVLTPYWYFRQVDETVTGSRNYFGVANRFNAITGEDLTYGG